MGKKESNPNPPEGIKKPKSPPAPPMSCRCSYCKALININGHESTCPIFEDTPLVFEGVNHSRFLEVLAAKEDIRAWKFWEIYLKLLALRSKILKNYSGPESDRMPLETELDATEDDLMKMGGFI